MLIVDLEKVKEEDIWHQLKSGEYLFLTSAILLARKEEYERSLKVLGKSIQLEGPQIVNFDSLKEL